MTPEPERWNQVKQLFAAALEQPDARRGDYLDAACTGDAELRAEVVGLLKAHTSAGGFLAGPTLHPEALPGAAPPGPDFPEQLGDFRLLRRLGGGGMGVVYVARQQSLGREVALKIVRPDCLYFTGARKRFRREVDAIARLKHPGIVPILAVGDENGVPYFAMELVEGCSLADALAELAQADRERPDGTDLRRAVSKLSGTTGGEVAEGWLLAGSWVRVALRIVRRVAQALNHAHERGILHRDVKPSNIMLCPDGRVLLLDFGIARLQGSSEITRTGSTLGSLSYMPPEQVRGGIEVDGRADVYALGVTLYEMLTRRLPFLVPDSERLRQAILGGSPEQPRKIAPGIPRDAETVCLKAMDLDRNRRYATMADFAQDLDHCLELRPIEARRTGPLLRVGRWIQRNPAMGVAAGLALLLVLGTPSALWLQQRNANLRLQQESLRAERNLVNALQAVHEMLTVVAEEDLKELPGLKPVRLDLLDRARRFFDSFLELNSDNPEVRKQGARTHCRLGMLQLDLGHTDDSLQTLGEVQRLLDPLVDDGTADTKDLLTLTTALRLSGRILTARREFERAEPYFSDALALGERVLAEHPGASEHVRSKCRTLNDLAVIRTGQGRFEETVELRQRAVAALDDLIAAEPDELLWQSQLGAICCNLITDLRRLGRQAEAESVGLRATSVLEKVAAAEPTEGNRSSYAAGLHNLGFQYMANARHREAVACYLHALQITEALVREFPSTPDHHASIGRSANNIAQILNDAGRFQEACQLAERAIAAQQRALQMIPGDPHLLDNLCYHYKALSDALAHLAQVDALHAIQARQVEVHPHIPWMALDAAGKSLVLVEALGGIDRPVEERTRLQEEEHRRAVRWLELAAERGMKAETLDEAWLDGLRGRADFAALRARLDAK